MSGTLAGPAAGEDRGGYLTISSDVSSNFWGAHAYLQSLCYDGSCW